MKIIKTELPITIITDDEYKQGDNLEMTRQRIEKAAIYLTGVFELMKAAAFHFEGETDTQKISNAFEVIVLQCDIGYGLADSILAAASCLTEFIPDEK